MKNNQRIEVIRERLQQAFSPIQLEVVDDSEQHKGHKGAEGGAGHYTVIIEATNLSSKNRVAAHREIYQVLQDLMPNEIHALKIQLLKP